jgi:hypothetical protein
MHKFLLAPMGVLAHRLRTLDRLLVPPSTQAEIFTLKHLPQPLRNHILSIGNPWTNFQNTPLSE